jgi:hypothetical protein
MMLAAGVAGVWWRCHLQFLMEKGDNSSAS